MKFLSLLLLPLFAHSAFATNNELLARKAVSIDVAESTVAISELRAMGPVGLDALVQTYQPQIRKHTAEPSTENTAEWRRITAALDEVSQQKDSYLSQLYWYTDMDAAKQTARASGKPILSLRLLGKLNEEFSCANSRFFRVILYSNEQVSKTLRERFVLHWQTVRDVPRITIDFGDGRKIERTITGNSIHYVLDSDGRLVDALPGLYGPTAFLRELGNAESVIQELDGTKDVARNAVLRAYHLKRANQISIQWLNDTTRIGGKAPAGFTVVKGSNGEAIQIMPLAVTKAITESSMLRSMTAGSEALGQITDEAAWNKIATLHLADAHLDTASIGVIQRQMRRVLAEENPKTPVQSKLNNLLQKLELSIALDSVRNEYLMHSKLHAWMVTNQQNVDGFNEKVYAELFLTPRSDPWLGLLGLENYTGLENAGVVR